MTEERKFQPLNPTKLSDVPWQLLYADILGPCPSEEYALDSIDGYYRYPEIKIINKTYSIIIIQEVEEIFSRHGFPITLKTDNSSNFTSTEFKEFVKLMALPTESHNPIGIGKTQKFKDSTEPYYKPFGHHMHNCKIYVRW